MPAGRPRKSNAEHKRAGTYVPSRHKKHETPPPPPADTFAPPDWLPAALRDEWSRLVADLRATGKPVTRSDLDALARAFGFLRRAERAGAAFDEAVDAGEIGNIAKLAGSLNSLAGRAYTIIGGVQRAVALRESAIDDEDWLKGPE